MSNPKYRTPIPDDKPKNLVYASKDLADAVKKVTIKKDKEAGKTIYGIDFVKSDMLPDDVDAIVFDKDGKQTVIKKKSFLKKILRK